MTTFTVGVVVAMLLVQVVGKRPSQTAVAVSRPDVGSLKLRGGTSWSDGATTQSDARAIELADGSRVELDPGTRLVPLENTDRTVVVLLGTGRALFEVQPGGPRRWAIEAGLATIEVVGTRFVVSRTTSRVTVEVERGIVLVRGERVPDRVKRLVAGERLDVEDEPYLPPAAAASSSAMPRASAAPSGPPREPTGAARDDASWRDLAEHRHYAKAYENLGAEGIAAHTKTADIDQLLALADVARFSGHLGDAVAPLRRIVAEHRGDPRAALAAFTLGRVHLDALGDPAAAAQDFADAIALGLPRALLEDAYLRLIEARAKAGDQHGAHEAWGEYHERFPDSTRRSTADQWRRGP